MSSGWEYKVWAGRWSEAWVVGSSEVEWGEK
jgi:hypothetical protein